jgi:hypothetical protein
VLSRRNQRLGNVLFHPVLDLTETRKFYNLDITELLRHVKQDNRVVTIATFSIFLLHVLAAAS